MPFTSPRAGGSFWLEQSGAPLLQKLSSRQKANLSYWIYHHNLQYRRFDEQAAGSPPTLDHAWVEGHRDRTPSSQDCLLTFLRELIRCDDAGEEIHNDLLMAAGGCRNDKDLWALQRHAAEQGWVDKPSTFNGFNRLSSIHLSARIHVEERTRELGQGRQGFVAMWFDDCMKAAYECGFKPALEAAGYEALRIDRKIDLMGGVVDGILAEIRKSRFVVADFTTSTEAGVRGGVYFEAGFAYGLGIPVFLTCRKDSTKGVHFNIGHINRLEWETSEDLREQLKNRIEAVLGRGPLNPSTDGSVSPSG